MTKIRWIIFLILLAFAVSLRFFPHPANFSAMTAIMFLAPLAVRPAWLAAGIAALAILLSDLKIGIYPGISFVYLSYFFIAGLGFFQAHLQRTATSKGTKFFGLAVNLLAGATAFFVISNLGVWLYAGMYAQNLEGLVECFVLAVPFFHKTLAAHLFFSAGLATAFALAVAAVKAPQKSRNYLK